MDSCLSQKGLAQNETQTECNDSQTNLRETLPLNTVCDSDSESHWVFYACDFVQDLNYA